MAQTLTFGKWFAKVKSILVSKHHWDDEDILASSDAWEVYYNAGYTIEDAIEEDRSYWN